MSKDEILSGAKFYCYNDKPVIIKHNGGKPFKYDGVFSLARLASPLTIQDKNILDYNGQHFADLVTISGPAAICGQFIFISKQGYGCMMILLKHIHNEPQKQKF